MNTLIATIAAYLIGSISFAVVMSRVFGLSDPRTYGSKNPGATNVLRSGSKKAAIATLIGDGAKDGWPSSWRSSSALTTASTTPASRWSPSPSSLATCSRSSSASSAARASPLRWACCSA